MPNMIERALAVISPKRAYGSYMARVAMFQSGQYTGARRDKTSMKAWTPGAGSADADSVGDLATLRARSRDLSRNNGIARGARNTTSVNVVGSGLRLKSQLQREVLGLSDSAAEAWEDNTEVLFDLWASSKACDITRTQNFYELQALALLSTFDSGDVFAVRRFKEGTSFIALCLQMKEADSVCDPMDGSIDMQRDIRDGIEVAPDGEAITYFFRNRHPGDDLFVRRPQPISWAEVPARGAAGDRAVLHLFHRDRIGLTRGVPMLAPVIEDLKQLDRYAEAELMAAVVSAFFTVFIKTTEGSDDLIGESLPQGAAGNPLAANQVALGPGSVVSLATGESIETAQSTRPNPNFDPFFLAIVRKIGVSLGIPYEVLIMHFTASYSASRAALETAWQFFMNDRTWLARNFCSPTYEWFLTECVARGVIDAPGFLDDPIRRAAWLGAEWIGPSRIVLDPVKEADAEETWLNLGVKTLEQVTTNQTGGDWFRNQEQRGREVALRKSLELNISPASPEVPKPQPAGADKGSSDAGT